MAPPYQNRPLGSGQWRGYSGGLCLWQPPRTLFFRDTEIAQYSQQGQEGQTENGVVITPDRTEKLYTRPL
ncbi:hypothetical protein ABO01nite_26110 [Asaia bogorensis NBRC 16594]|uniref:Uncharacterized protein n=1 Tax=Asaia bogorensis NBRC 16594 TaxID=1231624 RepID=A0AAN4R7P7_9PROT|nr:hypothetical protein ABO01nite_26110 [Asaia bogorensis NBRC 16594]